MSAIIYTPGVILGSEELKGRLAAVLHLPLVVSSLFPLFFCASLPLRAALVFFLLAAGLSATRIYLSFILFLCT